MAGADADATIAAAVKNTALALPRQFTTGGSLRERQFEQAFEAVLASDVAVHVLPSRAPALAHWRKPYAIDTTAVLSDRETLAIELKWGSGSLYNCAWDLAKLAVVVCEEVAPHAYLVAAAPAHDWAEASGAELFADRAWTPQQLGDHFRKHFNFWAKDVPTTGPIEVPAVFNTESVAVARVPSWSGDWSVRAARVTVTDATWVAWA
jgi:hypothetical protein